MHNTIELSKLLGMTLTNIFSFVQMDVDGLDYGECYLELNNSVIIYFPIGLNAAFLNDKKNNEYTSLFDNLEDIPTYLVNKEKKTIQEIIDFYERKNKSIVQKIRNLFISKKLIIKEYQPYAVEFHENKLKYIKNQKIADIIWYPGEMETTLFLLENGFIITETQVAPNGTGHVGLNYYDNLNQLVNSKGDGFIKFTEQNTKSQN
jgi:hypothetical protein